jgi:hypothetical protein
MKTEDTFHAEGVFYKGSRLYFVMRATVLRQEDFSNSIKQELLELLAYSRQVCNESSKTSYRCVSRDYRDEIAELIIHYDTSAPKKMVEKLYFALMIWRQTLYKEASNTFKRLDETPPVF